MSINKNKNKNNLRNYFATAPIVSKDVGNGKNTNELDCNDIFASSIKRKFAAIDKCAELGDEKVCLCLVLPFLDSYYNLL